MCHLTCIIWISFFRNFLYFYIYIKVIWSFTWITFNYFHFLVSIYFMQKPNLWFMKYLNKIFFTILFTKDYQYFISIIMFINYRNNLFTWIIYLIHYIRIRLIITLNETWIKYLPFFFFSSCKFNKEFHNYHLNNQQKFRHLI